MHGSLCTPARVGGSACGVDRTVEKKRERKKETNPVASAPSAVQRRQHSQSVDEPKRRRRRLAHSSVRGGLVKVLAGWCGGRRRLGPSLAAGWQSRSVG